MNSYTFPEVPQQYDRVSSWDEALYMLPSGNDLVPLDAQIISPLLGEAFSVPDAQPATVFAPSSGQWLAQPRSQQQAALEAHALHQHQQQQQALQAQLGPGYAQGVALPVHSLMQQQPGPFQSFPGLPYASQYGGPFGYDAWDASNRARAAASANGQATTAPSQPLVQPQARFPLSQQGSGTAAGQPEPATAKAALPHSHLPHAHQQQRVAPGSTSHQPGQQQHQHPAGAQLATVNSSHTLHMCICEAEASLLVIQRCPQGSYADLAKAKSSCNMQTAKPCKPWSVAACRARRLTGHARHSQVTTLCIEKKRDCLRDSPCSLMWRQTGR